ncbi:nuclear transport factor 2 family protein [Streptomyces sp. NPDC003691]
MAPQEQATAVESTVDTESVTERNKQLVRAFIAALNRQDPEGLGALLTADATWTVCARDIPGAGEHDRETVLGKILPTMLAIFVPGEPVTEIVRLVAEGDIVCAEAVSLGRLRHGAVYRNRYSHVYEIDRGLIRRIREYTDTDYAGKIMAGAVAAGHSLDFEG